MQRYTQLRVFQYVPNRQKGSKTSPSQGFNKIFKNNNFLVAYELVIKKSCKIWSSRLPAFIS